MAFIITHRLGEPYASQVELVSFHSISKGVLGECGRRGGYFEVVNFDEEVKQQLYKYASVSLCPSVHGQIGVILFPNIKVELMVNPPKKGDPSFEHYKKETTAIAG